MKGNRPRLHQQFAVYRYHAVFTDTAKPMLAAEATHRDHALVEQVIAELKNGPLAHLPSGVFTANAAWLACASIAFNLTRAAAVLAGAPGLAVGTRPRRVVPPRPARPPPRRLLTPAPGPRPEPSVEQPD